LQVKAQYDELAEEVARLEAQSVPEQVDERYTALEASLSERSAPGRPSLEAAQRLARVRRRSSEDSVRKPRSPSQRRIGVMRRRSREKEERARTDRSPEALERRARSPTVKAALTPGPLLLHRPSLRTARLQRGQPNSTSVGLERPLASPAADSDSDPGAARGRYKMSFKGRERPVVRREGPVRATQSPLGRQLKGGDSSLVSLKNDISDLIEKSFGSAEKQQQDGAECIGGDDVFDAPDFQVDLANSEYYDDSDILEAFENISVKSGGEEPVVIEITQSSPVTRAQLRRQSMSFQFARPAAVPQQPGTGLRRQSSAFEFQVTEPHYQNLSRDVASRASLRRRNSSVKDLIQRLETSRAECPAALPPRAAAQAPAFAPPPPRPAPSGRARPVLTEPLRLPGAEPEVWVDGTAFFNNLKELNAPQCGRNSIVKIRQENRGRVQDGVSMFSHATHTPLRPSSRRQSARLGVAGTPPALRLGAAPSQLATPLGLPSGRRSTLTGIRTTAVARGYAAPTIASAARATEPSPVAVVAPRIRKSPAAGGGARPRRSPNTAQQAKKSPQPLHPVYQNVRVERKVSNSRDLRKATGAAAPKERSGKSKVRRNRSQQERTARRAERADERRYLTIGCPGEMRSPLRETQNLLAVRRSNSDQTPGRKVVTRSGLQAEQENLLTAVAMVARKHSLRSDSLMSPHKVSRCPVHRLYHHQQEVMVASQVTRVKRAHSERSPRGPGRSRCRASGRASQRVLAGPAPRDRPVPGAPHAWPPRGLTAHSVSLHDFCLASCRL
jgi:hypothetical protein